MIQNDDIQKLMASVHTLDDQGLALLEKTLDEYIATDTEHRATLIEKKKQVQALRDAIRTQDDNRIAAIRKELGIT